MTSPSSNAYQSADVPAEIHDLIRRAAWQSANSTEDVAPHQYVVIGWGRDDLTEEEFWSFVKAIKTLGRTEEWTPPEEWVNRWGGRPMRNTYLYVGEHAYWHTHPRNSVPMLNREHVSVQQETPTRQVVELPDAPGQTQLTFTTTPEV
jgi:hypothetical protein